jgi:hypothetical protein
MNNEINDELKNIGSSLAGIGKSMPYAAPTDYFDMLGQAVSEAVSGEEKAMISGMDDRQVPYSVPAGYFEQLPVRMLQKTSEQKPAGILIPFNRLRWAAAAMFFIAIGLSMYTLLTGPGRGVENEVFLSSVADNEIKEYLAYNDEPEANKNINDSYLDNIQLDAKDIISYLDETGWSVD